MRKLLNTLYVTTPEAYLSKDGRNVCYPYTYGAFFYGELRHRVNVDITEELRDIVRQCARDMHDIFSKAVIPKAGYGKHCDKCSLKDICMPEMVNNCTSVDNYLTKNLYL